MSILDLIFPKKCVLCKRIGSFLCANCFSFLSFDTKSFCLVCHRPTFNGLTHPGCRTKYAIDGCFSALSYNKTARKLIYNFKHKPYLTGLKDLLGELFYESIIQNEGFNRQLNSALGKWVFVPMPLSKNTIKKRGYNQSEILTKELSKKLNLKYLSILKRIHATRNIFFVDYEKTKFQNMNVILVDDVVTTGNTLLEASKALKKAGVKKIIGLTLTCG